MCLQNCLTMASQNFVHINTLKLFNDLQGICSCCTLYKLADISMFRLLMFALLLHLIFWIMGKNS